MIFKGWVNFKLDRGERLNGRNPSLKFWQNSLRQISAGDREAFLQEAYFTNLYRARVFAIALLVFHVALLAVDFSHEKEGLWNSIPGYVYLFYMHLILIGALCIFILLFYATRKSSPEEVKKTDMVILLLFVVFMLLWSAGLSTVDQLIHSQITVYLIAIFAVGVSFYISGTYSLLLYSIAHIGFLTGIGVAQSNSNIALGHYINGTALVVIAWVLSRMVFAARVREFLHTKTIEQQKAQIESSKNKVESILRNILPESIVRTINGAGYPSPEYNESTTIVFADFVSFHKIAEKSDAREVVSILERMFGLFDETIRKYRLEKLKTIGDCYMFAGGLFTDESQTLEAVEASLEIVEKTKLISAELKASTGNEWAVRIGIHTGPAITGIIGRWRFIYDVWGPTVNIASRLESASLPNRVNVSKQVYELLAPLNKHSFEPRGSLSIKNMEPVEMFFVDRMVPQSKDQIRDRSFT